MKRSFLVFIVLALLVASISANAAAAKKTLLWTMCCSTMPERQALFEKVAQAYMDSHPDVEIKTVIPPGNYASAISTWIAAGDAPDVMRLGSEFYSFVDFIRPLDRFAATSKNVKDINSGILEMNKWEGKLLAIPFGINVHTMGYNRDLFNQSGLASPKISWTWDDAYRMAQTLTKDRNGDGTPDTWGMRMVVWEQWGFIVGGNFYTPDNRKAAFNNPTTVSAMQFFADLYGGRLGVAPVETRLASTIESGILTSFLNGDIGMTNIYVGVLPQLRQQAKSDVDVEAFPAYVYEGKQNNFTYLNTESYAINKNTPYPEIAEDFLAYLLSDEVMATLANSGYALSSQRRQAQTIFMKMAAPPKNLQAFLNSMAYAKQRAYNHPIGATVHSTIQNSAEFISMLRGQMPAATALSELEKRVNVMLDEYWAKQK